MKQNTESLLQFIKNAREQGMTNENISKAAEALGLWNEALIQAAILVPSFPSENDSSESTESSQSTTRDEVPDTQPPMPPPVPIPAEASSQAPSQPEHVVVPNTRQQLSQQHTDYSSPGYHYSSGSNVTTRTEANTEQLPILQAAVHHVSLWVFLFCSIPAIIYLIHFLGESSSSQNDLDTLINFSAVILVTGGLYSIMYGLYLRKRAKLDTHLRTGRILSIFTILFAIIGALISSIVLIIAILNVWWKDDSMTTMWSSLTVTVLFLVTIATYLATDSWKDDKEALRNATVKFAPLLSLLILVLLFVVSFLSAPSLVNDTRTQQDLVRATEKVVEFTAESGRLPHDTEFEERMNFEGISYHQLTDTNYELCASFERDTLSQNNYQEVPADDSYVSEWNFSSHASGKHCFELVNNSIENQPPYEQPIPRPMPSIDPVLPKL